MADSGSRLYAAMAGKACVVLICAHMLSADDQMHWKAKSCETKHLMLTFYTPKQYSIKSTAISNALIYIKILLNHRQKQLFQPSKHVSSVYFLRLKKSLLAFGNVVVLKYRCSVNVTCVFGLTSNQQGTMELRLI